MGSGDFSTKNTKEWPAKLKFWRPTVTWDLTGPMGGWWPLWNSSYPQAELFGSCSSEGFRDWKKSSPRSVLLNDRLKSPKSPQHGCGKVSTLWNFISLQKGREVRLVGKPGGDRFYAKKEQEATYHSKEEPVNFIKYLSPATNQGRKGKRKR